MKISLKLLFAGIVVLCLASIRLNVSTLATIRRLEKDQCRRPDLQCPYRDKSRYKSKMRKPIAINLLKPYESY